MPLPDANNYSMRIYELLKETDLENLSYAQFQGVAEKLFIEPENEDEMRRLVLVQLARMADRGDWDGFLNGGGGSGAPADAEYLIAFDGSIPASLTAARKLVVGNNISMAHGAGANDDVTLSATPGGSDGQIQYNVAGVLSATGLLSTNKTNELTIVAISGDGRINISSSTKAVSLLCDENQKLKVKGATDSFVLDVSSSSGGITFPDGTTQTTAASGSGGSSVQPFYQSTSQGLAVSAYWLLGLNPAYAGSFDNEAYTTSHTGFITKWSPPTTGSSLVVMGISAASASDNNYMWIYTESTTGYADTFIAKIKLPTSATGFQFNSQWLDASGSNITSPTFTKGTTYIAVLEIASGFTAASGRQAYLPFVLLANSTAFINPGSENYNLQYTSTISSSLSDSDINFFTSQIGWPLIGLEL